MPTLTIRERAKTATGFEATLSIDHQTEYDITISDPFDAKQEQELEFYFEEWIKFPFDQTVKAQRAADSIVPYGHDLFDQVFTNRRAYSAYEQACQQGVSNLQIEILGESPEFQALHWEALKDPDQPRAFAVDCVVTRKRFSDKDAGSVLQPSATINLLVVTARPNEESDVGYRTISRPLIEAIQQAQLQVNVELLRPGTYQALSEHLEEKEGYYHIVHFDVHGGLMTYDQFQAGAQQDRYTYQARYGRSDMQPYDGVKAFLFLEGEAKGKADPVEAGELAELLINKGIPVCILNACQSGKQVRAGSPPAPIGEGGSEETGAVETSLGSRLMAAGVQMVVAMGYSVTVSAAALMMEKLYGQLFAQKGIPEAIRLGRKELYNQKNRRVYFNQMVELEDWLLPVVYANREVDLKLRPMESRERAEYLMRRRQRYRFEKPTYGFVGRDLEILKLEKALLQHNILLLRGMGGTGKTTLLNYLREWWQTTGFVEEIFYFGYDESAHTLQQILRVVGKGLYPDQYDFAGFEAMPLGAQIEDVADRLRASSYGLVLDNLESVTGQPLAIQNTLPEAEQNQIKEFLGLLRGGKTKVLLGSRAGEEWLAPAFTKDGRPNVYALAGLDPESRSVLAEKVLAAQVKEPKKIAALRSDDGFKRLMKLLAGYPLAMEVVLGNMARQTPEEVLAGLQAADVVYAGGEERTNNILKCVEYSHSNLSPEAQKLLVCLAPFNGFVLQSVIGEYAKELKKLAPFQEYDFDQFDGAIQEAVNWGLLSPHESGMPGCLTIQPIFPYFLRTKLRELDGETRDALEEGFKTQYQGLAGQYQQLMESKEANQRQLGLFFCRLEYENLFSALRICLQRQDSICIYRCLDKYLDLVNDIPTKLKLSEVVCDTCNSYSDEVLSSETSYEISEAFLKRGVACLQTQDYQTAEKSHQRAIKVIKNSNVLDKENKQLAIAANYHQLGAVSQQLREREAARMHYQQALDILIKYDDRYSRYSQARTYHQLGVVAQELREYKEARSHYQQALDIFVEYQDHYSQASTYGQLGNLSQELREYGEARSHYQQALDIFVEHQDRCKQAITYGQLGNLSQELREYGEARSHYQQALDIFIEYQDRRSQASTYDQLGNLSQKLREYGEARSHYQQALDIFVEYQDRYNQASTYYQLGKTLQKLREYGEARSHYQQALDIFVEHQDRYNQASTYHQLGNVCYLLQEYGEARTHYQQALGIFIECQDRCKQAGTYGQLGLLAKTQEEYSRAQQYLQQALNIFVELNDQHSAKMTLNNLNHIYQTIQDEDLLSSIARIMNSTPDDVRQLFAKFSNGE